MKKGRTNIILFVPFAIILIFMFSSCILGGTGDNHTHTAEYYQFDAVSHWKVCDECGETFAKENHTIGSTCSVCGYSTHFTEGLKYKLDENTDTYTVVSIGNATDKELVIPTFYNGKAVTKIGEEAFRNNKTIEKVKITSNITTIGKGAFLGASIYSVDFTEARNLKIIDGEPPVGVGIGGAFESCDNLTQIILPQGLEVMGDYIFDHCDNLSEIVLPETVTWVGESAFRECPKLEKLNIPDSVTYIGQQCFEDSYNIKYEIYNDQMLYLDNLLVDIRPLDNTFYNSIEWKDGTIGIYETFEWNKQIKSIDLPDGIKFIGSDAFNNCTNLTSVTIPDSVITIGSRAFFDCDKLTSICLPKNLTFIDFNAFRGTSLESVIIPDSVKEIGDRAFGGCDNLEELILGSNLDIIGDYAFSGCPIITSVKVPNSVSYIGTGAFCGCHKLCEISFEENSRLQTIGGSDSYRGNSGTFSYCSSLVSIKLPDSVTTIGAYIFESCDSLKTVYFPKRLESIGAAIFYKTQIEKIYYEGTISEWLMISKDEGDSWAWDANSGEFTVFCADGEIAKDGTITEYKNI